MTSSCSDEAAAFYHNYAGQAAIAAWGLFECRKLRGDLPGCAGVDLNVEQTTTDANVSDVASMATTRSVDANTGVTPITTTVWNASVSEAVSMGTTRSTDSQTASTESTDSVYTRITTAVRNEITTTGSQGGTVSSSTQFYGECRLRMSSP